MSKGDGGWAEGSGGGVGQVFREVFDEKLAKEVMKSVRSKLGGIDGDLLGLLDRPIQREEIDRAIKKLRRGKAVGIDERDLHVWW